MLPVIDLVVVNVWLASVCSWSDRQLASSTLDASAKIYAGRVDAIHSEMYQVLGGLGRGASGSQKDSGKQIIMIVGKICY